MRSIIVLCLLFSQTLLAQKPITWTEDQLMDPAELAAAIKAKKNIPLIFSVGPSAIIPKSKDIGMGKDAESLKKLKEKLEDEPKDKEIVIYCGCCPFDRCPNVRPVIELLKEMKFTNWKLLDLPHNINIDWIEKGYPKED